MLPITVVIGIFSDVVYLSNIPVLFDDHGSNVMSRSSS